MENRNLFLSRLFSTGPPVVIAFDHGMFDGPIEGAEKVAEIPAKIWPKTDAVLMSPGILRDIGPQLCGQRDSPMPITRINWSTIYCFELDYHSGDIVDIYTPEQALRIGAQMVLISLSLRTGSQQRDAENIKVFTKLCGRAHELGLPVVGEYFPVDGDNINEDQLHKEIKIGCRILYELGADVIKTFYTKDFEQVVTGCPIPILTLGGDRLPSDLEVLKYAQQQIKSGAAGIVFGRNVIQSRRPIELQKALAKVVKSNKDPEDTARKFGLL